jgi:hypothetical protein
MHNIDPHKTGLCLGALVGGVHFVWALLVLFGLAQPFLDFIFMLHMLRPTIIVDGFSAILALSLVLVTGIIGYLMGYFFAVVWNRLHG